MSQARQDLRVRAERAVLVGLTMDAVGPLVCELEQRRMAELVPVGAFSTAARRAMAEAAWRLGRAASLETLPGELARTGLLDDDAIEELRLVELRSIDDRCDWHAAALVLRELWSRDEMARLARRIAQLGGAEGASAEELQLRVRAEFEAFEAARLTALRTDGRFLEANAATAGAIVRMQRAARNELAGRATGFRLLDVITGGMQPGHLWVLGARTSHGKSALALDICAGARDAGPSLWFSMEMGQDELRGRLIARESGVSERSLRAAGGMRPEDGDRIAKAAAFAAAFPLLCDETSSPTMAHVRRVATEQSKKAPMSCVVVDNLQLMQTGRAESKRVGYEEITRQCKALAKDLQLPVLLLVQLSRGVEREGRAPSLVDLRDSGSIEQDADTVVLIQRWERAGDVMREPAKLVVAKGRGSGTGAVKVWFYGPRTTFEAVRSDEEKAWDAAVAEAASRQRAEASTKKLKGRGGYSGGADA